MRAMRNVWPAAVAGICLAGEAGAQSSHLVLLESTGPATAADQITAIASRGWAGMWSNPSADPTLTGAMLGAERNGFGAVRTIFAQVAVHAGPRWSLALAQTSVANLFDPDLLAQDPSLEQLRAGALTVTTDAATPLGSRLAGSLGLRYAADELLGTTSASWAARVGAAVHVGRGIVGAAIAERVLDAEGGDPGAGRVGIAASSTSSLGSFDLTAGAGLRSGDLWRAEHGSTGVSGSLAVRVGGLLTLGAALGAEQNRYLQGAWDRTSSWWAGVTVSRVAIQLRLSSRPGEAESVLGVAAALTAKP